MPRKASLAQVKEPRILRTNTDQNRLDSLPICVLCVNPRLFLPTGDADAALDESFDFERHAFRLRLSNEVCVDLEDAQLHEVFDLEVHQTLITHLGDELRRHLENLHLHEAFKRLLFEAHLRHLSHELRIDLEDARLDEIERLVPLTRSPNTNMTRCCCRR